jgi:hypothetical protein
MAILSRLKSVKKGGGTDPAKCHEQEILSLGLTKKLSLMDLCLIG